MHFQRRAKYLCETRMDTLAEVTRIACKLVSIDSRSDRSNVDVLEATLGELLGFEIERIDYRDEAGRLKRVAVARSRPGRCAALCAHVDTVLDTGWSDDPLLPRVTDGVLHGLGAVDMKGPLASLLLAAHAAARSAPVMVILTGDEETTKAGARTVVERSTLIKSSPPAAIVIAEPTGMVPVRAHRTSILFSAEATGEQAHAATGRGRNAVWPLVDFLHRVDGLRARLHTDTAMTDVAFDPPVCDIAVTLDGTGTALNVTAPRSTARLAWRYSASVDPHPFVDSMRRAAVAAGVALDVVFDGRPLELAADHPVVRLAEGLSGHTARTMPFSTDASEFQAVAPCLIMGPGDIAHAHTPDERVGLADLAAAVPLFSQLAVAIADGASGQG